MDAILLGAATCLLLQLFPLTRARALAAWMLPVCLIAAIAVGLFGAFHFDVVQDFAYGMTAFPLLAVAAALVLLTGILRDVDGQKCWIHARFLSYLGRISYGLYLLHSPIRAAIRDRLLLPEQFGKYFGHEVLGQLVFYVVATSASIAAAHLSFYGFERIFLKAQRVFRSPSRESHAAITA